MRGTRSERLIGSIAGFQVFVADNPPWRKASDIVKLRGATLSRQGNGPAPRAPPSVEHTIQHLDDLMETLERNIADTRKRYADTQIPDRCTHRSIPIG